MSTFKRSVGPWGLMFTAISGMLGSAWLFGPFYAAQIAGPAAIISWLIGAVVMLIIAMTFAELTSMFPITGAHARFMQFSHGGMTSFLFGWIMWLGYAAVAPAETMAILQYLSSSFPVLIRDQGGVTILSTTGYCVAAAVLFSMCVINLISIKWLARYNSVVVWIKMLVPALVAVVIIALLFRPHPFVSHGFMPNGWDSTLSALSLGGVIFAFSGYAPAIVLAGEAKNPQKTIPLVLGGGLLICFLVYVSLQIALIGAVSDTALANGWSHLQFAGSQSPFIGMAESLHQDWLRYLILITAVITPLGTAIIFIATSARVAYAMSENGFFPKSLQVLNKRGVPALAVMINFFVGMVLFFPVPGWQGMMGFLVAAFVLSYAIGPLAVLALRKQIPNHQRRFRVPCVRLWCFLSFFFANLILYWTGWAIYSKMLIGIVLGLLLMIFARMRCKEKHALDMRHSIWAFAYILGIGIIAYFGQFGGTGLIPKNDDIVVIALFSALMLLVSYYYALPAAKTKGYMQDAADAHEVLTEIEEDE